MQQQHWDVTRSGQTRVKHLEVIPRVDSTDRLCTAKVDHLHNHAWNVCDPSLGSMPEPDEF